MSAAMHHPHVRHRRHGAGFARGLGWFSLGLGLAELLAPKGMARALGMPDRAWLVQAYGLREIATGVGILMSRDPTPWVWGRVAGDALDLATVAPQLREAPPVRDKAMLATAAVAAAALADLACARQLAAGADHGPPPDYSHRRGFPEPPERMRGLARSDAAAAATGPVVRPAA